MSDLTDMAIDKKATLTYVQLMKEDLAVFRLVPEDGVIPDYDAGQFITVGMPIPSEDNKLIRRAYSMASHPENKEFIELVVRWVRKPLPGRVTTALFNAGEGDEVSWIPPTGVALKISEKLADGSKDERRIVCVSGGTGIAPFMSFARHLHAIGDHREIINLHGSSYVDELSYKDELTAMDQESLDRVLTNELQYRASISRPQEWFNRSWTGQTGRVEQFVKPENGAKSPLEELVGEKITPHYTIFYVCAWQGTVDGVFELCTSTWIFARKRKRKSKRWKLFCKV